MSRPVTNHLHLDDRHIGPRVSGPRRCSCAGVELDRTCIVLDGDLFRHRVRRRLESTEIPSRIALLFLEEVLSSSSHSISQSSPVLRSSHNEVLGGRGFFRFCNPDSEGDPMTYALIAASSVLVVLLTLVWAKEFRLRRALQTLLARIFSHWRTAHEANDPPPQHRNARGRDALGRYRRM